MLLESVCLGRQQPSRQWKTHLKRTFCPKAIKTGRWSVGESLALWFASADDYTSLLHASLLFPPLSLCISCIISVHSRVHTHEHLPTHPSLSSLPFSFSYGIPVCECACGEHKNRDIPCGIICTRRAEKYQTSLFFSRNKSLDADERRVRRQEAWSLEQVCPCVSPVEVPQCLLLSFTLFFSHVKCYFLQGML